MLVKGAENNEAVDGTNGVNVIFINGLDNDDDGEDDAGGGVGVNL